VVDEQILRDLMKEWKSHQPRLWQQLRTVTRNPFERPDFHILVFLSAVIPSDGTENAMPDKIIATNESALKAKYRAAGLAAIKSAIKQWIAADQARSLRTAYIVIDSVSAMAKVDGKPSPAPPIRNRTKLP
jgi:hypothetical protein